MMAAPRPPLFTLGTDPKSKRQRWYPDHLHLRRVREGVPDHEDGRQLGVKTPLRKTNNQASFGGSLLKNNI
jgi:hypothetical protein